MHSRSVRHPQMRSAPIGSMLLLLGALCLSGCAPQVAVTSAWQDNVPHNQTFKRVLIVGVTPDIDQRCGFELFLASRLQSDATTAIASCQVVNRKEPLTRESIDAAIAAQQADAVVATLLVSKEWKAEEGGSRDTRGGAYYKATDSGWASGYYGAYGVPVIYGEFQTADSVLTMRGEIQITTRLFETRGATLLYTLETKGQDFESRDGALAAITGEIADQLRKDGLVR